MWLASDNMKSGKRYGKEKKEYCAGQEFHYSVEANILSSEKPNQHRNPHRGRGRRTVKATR
jgi:hypothetical protein